MIYIIIWAIISTGDMTYVNPIYEHTICIESELAYVVQEIRNKAYQVDIKIYKAEPVEYEYSETSYTAEIEKKEPHIKIKEDKII